MADQPGDLQRTNECAMFALVDIRDRQPVSAPRREPVAVGASGAGGVSRGTLAWHKLWRS